MEAECNARIFVGGRTKGFKGKCPGILEELMIALDKEHPVFLIGAFGGVTKHVIGALQRESSEIFSTNYYYDNEHYKEVVELYKEKGIDSLDFSNYYSKLEETGFEGIAKLNGLTVKENLRLAVTPHINEIVFLVLKGLAIIANKR